MDAERSDVADVVAPGLGVVAMVTGGIALGGPFLALAAFTVSAAAFVLGDADLNDIVGLVGLVAGQALVIVSALSVPVGLAAALVSAPICWHHQRSLRPAALGLALNLAAPFLWFAMSGVLFTFFPVVGWR
jgi:hypothetical protein